MNGSLPLQLERRWGNLHWVRQRGHNEWSAECPKCGDSGHAGNDAPDRFRMFGGDKPRGWCRRCGYQDFADSDKREFVITPEMRLQWIKEREERERSELEKTMRALDLLRRERSWIRYHENLGSVGREFWMSKGVPDWAVEYYQLGWCYDKIIWSAGQEVHTQTATIPIFEPGWNLVNLRHRLINPPDPNDKYRPDRAGLGQQLYLTDPDNEPSGETILVEGEIKAIVIATSLDMPSLCTVGVPGKNPGDKLLTKLSRCDRVHVILDPDATKQAIQIARSLGTKRARVVALPCKPDDAFTKYGATRQEFLDAVRYGRVVL